MKTNLNIPSHLIAKVVDSIVCAVPVKTIYVFGSYARDDATSASDLDLYVITSDDVKRPLAYGGDIRQALLWMPIARDVLTAPQELFDERKKQFWKVEARVAEEGVKIYG